MPLITVFPDTVRAYNRVEIDWADTPSVSYAKVLRVDVVTGECVPLRPYICYDGDYLALSCGHGIFWDTEVPLDRQVYYITEGLDAPCIPADPVILDTYDRTETNGWGSAPIGGPYSYITGLLPQYSVTPTVGGRGRIEFDAVGSAGTKVGPNIGSLHLVARIRPEEVATGARFDQGVTFRVSADDLTRYEVLARFETTGLVGLRLLRLVNGVTTVLVDAITIIAYTAASNMTIIVEADGRHIMAKVFDTAGPEPTTWDIDFEDSLTIPSGQTGAFIRVQAGNTNQPDFLPSWDYLEVSDLCLPCEPVTADTSSGPTTMASNGAFRLRNPVRPCSDLYVPLCFNQANPGCLPVSGIFFASMDNEVYAPNSLILNPTNASLPLSVNRARRGVASLLTVVTRTFADRDALLALAAPGEPLMLAGPPQYGVKDVYMAVGDLSVDRELSNHKYPVRVNQLPFLAVNRPAGPSLGVCGSRMADLCDIYSTFDEMAAAGLTWDNLIQGLAGDEDPTTGYRTWDSGQAEFADWNDANDGIRTWIDMEVGD